jgi:L-threonylcarbamoyladenylate synthase
MRCTTWSWGDGVEILVEALAAGGVLAIPTESSYALAVDPRSKRGVAQIYRIKGRERGKPLPVVVANLAQALALGVAPDAPGLDRAGRHWPGPLSLLVSLARPLPASAGDRTLAIRIPGHPRLWTLLADLGCGLTATSANASGEPPLTDPAQVAALLVDWRSVIVDDGVLPGGPPSTLVAWEEGRWRVLRPGAIAATQLALSTDASSPERG